MQLSITLIIIIITALVSIGGFNNPKIINDLIFYGPAVRQQNQWYRFFTCGFIHADWSHLIFNMLSLFFFGPMVEQGFTALFGDSGKWIYILFYISALAISILPTYLKQRDNYQYRSLGASGAVSAVIFAGMMLDPTISIYIFFIPIAIPGFIFGPLYILISAYMDRKGGDNINHSAHIWGALYGLAFIIAGAYVVGYPIIQSTIDAVAGYFN